jgi:large subunit ribosomal protein L1
VPHPDRVQRRHADEQLRGTISLPQRLGRAPDVASSPRARRRREATEAGADIVGDEDLAQRVQEGFLDFDVAIAAPT